MAQRGRRLGRINTTHNPLTTMVKINYGFEKRRKEMEKKRKKEEKLKAKAANKAGGISGAPVLEPEVAAEMTGETPDVG